MNPRPNILMFLMDGVQSAALQPGSGCQIANFERLKERGVVFERAYTTCPTCSPARASLMTGLLPHNHGVLEVEHGRDPDQVELRTDRQHWAQQLQAAGYHTAYFGKWHIERSNDLQRFGWEVNRCKAAEHHAGLGQGVDLAARLPIDPELSRYIEGPPGYNRILHYGVTDVPPAQRYPQHTIDQVLQFLEHAEQDERPWSVCASFSEPNESLVVSRETFERYRWQDLPLPENLRDDFSDRPAIYRREQALSSDLTDDQWRMARACYFGRITELDDQFGRVLDYLTETDQIENTLIVLTADHGRYVGAHGFDAHNFGPFEEIYRVPLVVAGPDVSAGRSSAALVSLQDLGPTLLELATASPLDSIDGQSFAATLTSADADSDFTEAYAEYFGTRFRLTQRILWQGTWKYVFNGFDYDEFYDLATDPHEMTNLAQVPEFADRADAMMGRIWERIQESGDRTLSESHYYSMRLGRVGPGYASGVERH